MKTWIKAIYQDLDDVRRGTEPEDGAECIIWSSCRKILEDDSGDVSPLEAVLAELLLESLN